MALNRGGETASVIYKYALVEQGGRTHSSGKATLMQVIEDETKRKAFEKKLAGLVADLDAYLKAEVAEKIGWAEPEPEDA